ncbi:hypothetical protein BKP54_19465 [Ensifer sp. 1H6]|nr:hypothetical protein BKP54_19465 [Ensifer sp. 1H6]
MGKRCQCPPVGGDCRPPIRQAAIGKEQVAMAPRPRQLDVIDRTEVVTRHRCDSEYGATTGLFHLRRCDLREPE